MTFHGLPLTFSSSSSSSCSCSPRPSCSASSMSSSGSTTSTAARYARHVSPLWARRVSDGASTRPSQARPTAGCTTAMPSSRHCGRRASARTPGSELRRSPFAFRRVHMPNARLCVRSGSCSRVLLCACVLARVCVVLISAGHSIPYIAAHPHLPSRTESGMHSLGASMANEG